MADDSGNGPMVVLLRDIWQEMKTLNSRVNGTNERLEVLYSRVDGTNERLEALRADTNERLERVERRQTESDLHVTAELVNVAKAVDAVHVLLRENLAVRDRVADHERRIETIERRIG